MALGVVCVCVCVCVCVVCVVCVVCGNGRSLDVGILQCLRQSLCCPLPAAMIISVAKCHGV